MGNWECVPIPGYELCGSELVALVLGVRHGIGMGNWEYVPIVHGKIITTHFLGHIHTHTHTHTHTLVWLWGYGFLVVSEANFPAVKVNSLYPVYMSTIVGGESSDNRIKHTHCVTPAPSLLQLACSADAIMVYI